jgi:outer membrane protein TolC
MRWKNIVAGLALAVTGVVGCKQQCFLSECDFQHYHDHLGLPAGLEAKPNIAIKPLVTDVPPPTNVLDPDRPIRYLSLAEAIAIALEHGNTGIQSVTQPGINNDNLSQFTGNGLTATDSIRVLAIDPAIRALGIENSLARFDVRWTTSMTWNTSDRPIGSALDTFQAANNRSATAIETQEATFNTSLVKPLASGGTAGITFNTDYQLSNLNPRVNPAYRPTLQFQFTQPLLQAFGVEINQLRPTHPSESGTGSSTIANLVSAQNPPDQLFGGFQVRSPQFIPGTSSIEGGILVTRVRFDQQRIEFEKLVAFMLLNVETAYWNLYNAYWTLYSREQALRQAYEAWKINRLRYEAGRIPLQDFAQTRVQYESFRAQRITALGQVLESERQLRGLLGMVVEDGQRLVPVDTPTLAPYQPDWSTSLQEALTLRPELQLARQELKLAQLDVINIKNLLLPDLRFVSTYDINGIGSRLDSGSPDNAFRSLASGKFTDYAFGLQLNVPLGYRGAHAQVRNSRLRLAQSYFTLQDQELKAQRYLAQQWRNLFQFYQLIEANRAQREAAAQQLEARFKEFLAGRGTLDILLEAQRFWADALRDEYTAISQYNSTLASFEFAKGTILQHDSVVISEGPLPQCAQVRAADHEKERAKGLVIRERAKPVCLNDDGCAKLPVLPPSSPASVPSVLAGEEKMPAVPATLPQGPDTLKMPRVVPPPPPGTAPTVPSAPAINTLPPSLKDSPPAAGGPAATVLEVPPLKK